MVGFVAEQRPFLWTDGEGGNDEDDLKRLKVGTGNVYASWDNVSIPMNWCVGVESYSQDRNGLWRVGRLNEGHV
nr:hypothetical protein CFP56_79049 [Quercus suber]